MMYPPTLTLLERWGKHKHKPDNTMPKNKKQNGMKLLSNLENNVKQAVMKTIQVHAESILHSTTL